MSEEPVSDDLGISPFLRLLWNGENNSRPGPKRGVDLATIADVGVRIADAEGIAAVSMRRLATEVGFTTMALYRYVRSKTEALALLMDRAYGPPTPLAAPPYWRSQLAAWAAANRDVLVAHPWILDIRITEPPLAPNQIGWMEIGLAAMAGTSLSEQEKLSALLLVDVYVRGQTQLSLQLTAGDSATVNGQLYARRLLALIEPHHLPFIRASLTSGALSDDDDDFATDEFAFGLDSVLLGIAARMERRENRPSRS